MSVGRTDKNCYEWSEKMEIEPRPKIVSSIKNTKYPSLILVCNASLGELGLGFWNCIL